MEEIKDFVFIDENINKRVAVLKESMAGLVGSPVDDIKCVGVSIHMYDTRNGVLMSNGIYVNGFDPSEFDDDSDGGFDDNPSVDIGNGDTLTKLMDWDWFLEREHTMFSEQDEGR